RAITDAVRETYDVVNLGRALQGMPALAPNGGARFHFEAPGSMQGFRVEGDGGRIQNVERQGGARNLALRYPGGGPVRALTPTFIPPEAIAMPGYTLLASPTLYPGQEVQAAVGAAPGNSEPVAARLLLRVYGPNNQLETVEGPSLTLAPGELQTLTWIVPGAFGAPIAEVGVEAAPAGNASGTLYLDFLTWSGTPDVVFTRQADGGDMWRRAWVDGVDQVDQWPGRWPQPYRIVQNEGTGLISQGTAEWRDMRASATINVPLANEAGIAVRVGGMRRWYALFLCHDGIARLVKARDGRRLLAEAPLAWNPERDYDVALEAAGSRLRGWVNDDLLFDVVDEDNPLLAGGISLIVSEGRLMADEVAVRPA
ncbi:MAG TPA: hypothetical protein VFQ80_17115, partial [Thermomicrobiales bacterium]|nr:hypothetical protein [Thermomicrobiales bacterium]